jgi:hypothetical protein
VAIARRIEKLTAKIGTTRKGGLTFEELCRKLWRQNQRGFLALAEGDCPFLRVFVSSFRREDAERGVGSRKHARAR